MFVNPKKLIVISAGMLTMCVGMRANAGSVTESASFGPTQTNFSDTLSLSKFTGPGTLTGVTLIYSESATSTGSVTNYSTNQVLNYSVSNSNVLSTTASTSFLSLVSTSTSATADQSGSVGIDTSPGNTGNTMAISSSSSNGATKTYTSGLSNFTGAGSLSFLFTGTGSASDSPSSNQNLNVRTKGSGTVEIIYDYNPIPEASTLLGLGGLLGVGGLQLRRLMRKRA